MLRWYFACFLAVAAASPLPAGEEQKTEDTRGSEAVHHNTLATSSPHGFELPALKVPVADQESAKIESTFKENQAFDSLQSFYIRLANPKPIVDTIEEHDKYGNDGQQHQAVGTAVVRTAEAISRIVNTAIDGPKSVLMKLSRGTTDLLNQFGAKLIGL